MSYIIQIININLAWILQPLPVPFDLIILSSLHQTKVHVAVNS